jgi:uncharacterized protein
MIDAKIQIILNGIERIVRQIVKNFDPQQIILFGSYAYGTPTEDSDVDLLILMNTEAQPIHAAAQIAATIDHPFPLDIVVSTPSAWKASLERNGVFATEVMKKGVVLYEA